MLRAGVTIAGRDLRSRLRDRSALVVAFAAPLGLAVILSVALGGGGGFATTYGLVDEDGQALGEAFATEVLGDESLADTVTVERYPAEAAAREALDADEVSAVFVVPGGFTSAVRSGEPATLRVLRGEEETLSGDLAEGLAAGFTASLDARSRSVATAVAGGADPAAASRLAAAAGEVAPALTLAAGDVDAARRNAASYFGPSMAVFFVFFVVSFGPSGLLRERREGTLARLRAAPVTGATILAGKSLAVLVLALGSMGVMWGATTAFLGATWGHPAGVAALCVAIVLAATGITALIATLARTDEQADGWTSITVFSLALLGGNFADVSALPPVLAAASAATPNGWAMRGFVDLAAGAGPGTVVGPVAAILAFAVVTLAVTGPRVGRLLGDGGAR